MGCQVAPGNLAPLSLAVAHGRSGNSKCPQDAPSPTLLKRRLPGSLSRPCSLRGSRGSRQQWGWWLGEPCSQTQGRGQGTELGPPVSLSTHIMEKKDLSSLSLSRKAARAPPSSGVRCRANAHVLGPDDLALNPDPTSYQLCDTGQVTEPL